MSERRPHDNSAHKGAIEFIVANAGWETSRFLVSLKLHLTKMGLLDPEEFSSMPKIVPDLYRINENGVFLLEVENTSRAIGGKLFSLMEWFGFLDGYGIPMKAYRCDLLFKQLIPIDFEAIMLRWAREQQPNVIGLHPVNDARLISEILEIGR